MSNNHTITQVRRIEEVLAKAISPPTRLLPSEWANEHRELSKEANAQGGKWTNLPMQVEPMDSCVDPEVQSTCLMWASQTAGKTELLLNIAGFFMHHDPSPMIMIQPTLEMGEAWSKDRFTPMVRDTPCLRSCISKNSRDQSNTILHKTFRGGHLTIAGANSSASLASRPIRVKLFDEIDRFPASAGKEGDPIALTEKRSDTFWNDVSFKTSTPTIKKHSRIEKEFDLSDKRYWFVLCPYCEFEQRLKWAQVRIDEELPQNTKYECENQDCKEHWSDVQRVAAIYAGRWIATAPFKGVRGYHLNGIYSLFKAKKGFQHRLHQMAVEFINNKTLGKETYKVWVNTFLAETYEEESEVKPEWHPLEARKEPYMPTVPKGVIIVTFGVDFQKDRIEYEFLGHGHGEESWGLGHHVIYGDTRQPAIYAKLEAGLLRQFVREDGARLNPKAGGFDTGYAACQRPLYAWLRPRLGRRYFALKGSSQKNAEPIGTAFKSKVERVRLLIVGTNRIKSYIYSRATITEPGPGYMHFPAEYTTEWFKQLLSEDFHNEIINGAEVKVFYKPEVVDPEQGSVRNEALDIRVYAQAALYARGGMNWELEEKRNLATIPAKEQHSEVTNNPHQEVVLHSAQSTLPMPDQGQKRRKTHKKGRSRLLRSLNSPW